MVNIRSRKAWLIIGGYLLSICSNHCSMACAALQLSTLRSYLGFLVWAHECRHHFHWTDNTIMASFNFTFIIVWMSVQLSSLHPGAESSLLKALFSTPIIIIAMYDYSPGSQNIQYGMLMQNNGRWRQCCINFTSVSPKNNEFLSLSPLTVRHLCLLLWASCCWPYFSCRGY